ncbi:GntR family transcriptional regulator [Companilactobacillus ginsenosidimutans]|uniref:GntR family transcriptional regulator n=1 Tax=Companilactobacillus ginsenosidimutans TaxID=1007676 RepID=A0A0H4R0H2_9LACO|nr:GntR family transcriptional regulator [Companilactobacillus ginsenosidimutans]AKP67220.1 GntR family transcriptional regulator [Companilactobacillus ginsenosidimutans]
MKFDDKIPIYLQIQSYLYNQIIIGDIQPGEKLPSVRQLAVDVTANVNTVQRSLTEMVNDKIIESQRGKGNFVTTDIELINDLKSKLVLEQISIAYEQLHSLNLTDQEILSEFKKYIEDRGATNV